LVPAVPPCLGGTCHLTVLAGLRPVISGSQFGSFMGNLCRNSLGSQ
jgi:hypothetical protein